MAEKTSKKGSTVSVDFTGVSESGGSFRVAPGEYAVKIKTAKMGTSKAGKPKITWELEGINGAVKGKKMFLDTSLQEQALFKLRNLLLACKVDVPKSKMNISLDKMKGLVLGVVIDDDEYKGKTKSAIIDTFPVTVKKDGKMIREDISDEDDDYDSDDEDIEDVDEESSEYEDMEDEELKVACKERGIKVKKSWTRDQMIEALEELEEEDEDDE